VKLPGYSWFCEQISASREFVAPNLRGALLALLRS